MSVINALYRVDLPFFIGSFSDAKKEAQSRCKYLLLYLDSPKHPFSAPFVRQFLCCDSCRILIRDHFLLFGASVTTREGYNLSCMSSATTFPFIAVFIKSICVMKMQGDFACEEFLLNLELAVENAAPIRAKEVELAAERAQTEALRQRSEDEYEKARRIDEETFAKLRREEDEARRAEEEREQKKNAEKAAAEVARAKKDRQRKELLHRKEVAATALGNESESICGLGPESIATIRILSLDGTPNERQFPLTAPLSYLYHFAVLRPEYDGRPFKLVTGFPPSGLPETDSQTVESVPALYPRCVVKMMPLQQ